MFGKGGDKKGGERKGFWDSYLKNPFGGVFDFNRNGKEELHELWVGHKIYEDVTKRNEDWDDYSQEYGFLDPDYAWRLTCEDGMEFGIYPEDYETEEEYEEALNEVKYAWRDDCEDMSETGVDPEDYETEEEYEKALNEVKYAWRDDCEDMSGTGVDPEDYETEEEYEEALNEAKYAWRDDCEDMSETGVDPEDYETEEEYREALENAQPIKKSDYPNKRRYNAACVLVDEGRFYLNDEFGKQEKNCCRFIIENADSILAANYLSHESGFLYAQAVKDHFKLTISLPDEDEEREFEFSEMILKLAKRDISLSLKIWEWCLEQFLPYAEFDSYALQDMTTDVLNSISRFPDEYRVCLVHYMDEHPDFRGKILSGETDYSFRLTELITMAIREGLNETAQFMFDAGIAQAKGNWKKINSFVKSMILDCKDDEEVETIEYFRDEMFGKIKEIDIGMVQDEIGGWEKEIADYIDYVEQRSDRYAYSRRNAWRRTVPDGKEYGLDPVYYSSEQEYLDALEGKKYGWRKWYEDRDTAGIDPADYETLDEFQKAYNEQVRLQRKKKEEQELRDKRAALMADKSVYIYCGVLFPFSARPYSYISDMEDVQIGDTVVVSVGDDGKEMEGEVISIGRYLRIGVPFPVEKTKHILKVIPKESY